MDPYHPLAPEIPGLMFKPKCKPQPQPSPQLPKKPRRPTSRQRARLVRILLGRHGDLCHWCGKQLGRDITLEHLQPLSRGGTNAQENLRLVHDRCNR